MENLSWASQYFTLLCRASAKNHLRSKAKERVLKRFFKNERIEKV
jgi:hypothetical protein